MARSHAIWVVIDTARPLPPITAFTVKNEMQSWLRKQSPIALARMQVYRYENAMPGGYGTGGYPIPEELTMESLVSAE